MGETIDSPFPAWADAKRITGDWYFVPNKYPKWLWTIAAVFSLLVPPAGVFMAVFMVSSSIHTPGDEIEAVLK